MMCKPARTGPQLMTAAAAVAVATAKVATYVL